MCRRRSSLAVIAAAIAACLTVSLAAQHAGNDWVGAYLERHGLSQLLAVHLEELLEETTDTNEREALQVRLVGLYAQLVDETDDPTLRAVLEERSIRLLATASEESGFELKIALLRARYRTTEKVAENHRLRQADPEALERAREQLPQVIRELNTLRGRIEQQLRAADNRLSRATGVEAVVLTDRADELARMHARTTFLSAWALYYQSWLHQRPDNARVAEGHFATLLRADSARPEPDEISEDLRADEAVARSILGMGLCKSLTSSSATAIRWLELLEHERSFVDVRDEIPAWKIAVYLEHAEYREARQVLVDYQMAGSTAPLAWVRLAAVHALEADNRSRSAAELARETLASLAARGELRQVLDLSERYGADALGNQGFAFRYVHGVQSYQRARDAHADDNPTRDAQLIKDYNSAANEFNAALAEPDTDRYPAAATSCRSLVAWCWYFQGRFLEARKAFELAAAHMPPEEAAEAMWMAVVSLDQVVQAGPRGAVAAIETELWDLIDRVLSRYPNGPNADKLILKRAVGMGEISPEIVEDLLSISVGSDTYDAAQRRAAYTLYRLFREGRGDARLAYGNEYLAVALPLVSHDANTIDPDDAEAVGQYVARSRRVLEVALTRGIDRVVAAANVLSDLEELERLHGLDLDAHRDELDYRRIQQHLQGDQVAAANVIADRVRERDPASLWMRLANRALFEHAVVQWRRDDQVGLDPAVLAQIIRHGERIIQEYAGDSEARGRSGVLAYWITVAEAHFRRWERSGDPGAAAAARKLYDQILEVRANDAKSLRATALLAEDLGDPQRAIACWRILANGSKAGTHVWYESKFRLISLLAQIDGVRARSVMDQHKALNPSLGPEPWASRFKALDGRIPTAQTPDHASEQTREGEADG